MESSSYEVSISFLVMLLLGGTLMTLKKRNHTFAYAKYYFNVIYAYIIMGSVATFY